MVGGYATVADCQTTFFRRFKQIGNILKKVAERQLWSEVTRPSADCQTTFIHVSSNLENFWKKSLNGRTTVVGVHATVGRLSNNVFWTFQTFWKKLLNGHATEVRDHATVDRLFSISLFALATVVLSDGANVVSVVLLSFQRYKVVNIKNFECWPVRAL